MFPYDPALLAAVSTRPTSIAELLQVLRTIDATCIEADGLKWFNWLYIQVTQAIGNRVTGGGLNDPDWLVQLDLRFATLYFNALEAGLQGLAAPGCWRALLSQRANARIARIQFALAGSNAHINHDLPQAIFANCQTTGITPRHGSPKYDDYTALNATLDPLIENAKAELRVRLLGDPLPEASHVEDVIAAWSLTAAREAAWSNAEVAWHVQALPALASAFTDTLDGLTTVASKALLTPAP